MKTILYLISLLILAMFFSACSTTEETTKENTEPEVYVFDDISDVDTSSANDLPEIVPPSPQIMPPAFQYIVQVGAFTSEDRAQSFINNNKSKIDLQNCNNW